MVRKPSLTESKPAGNRVRTLACDRPPGWAANEIRVRHQPQDHLGTRTRRAAGAAGIRRRGGRIALQFAAMHESASGTFATWQGTLPKAALGSGTDITDRLRLQQQSQRGRRVIRSTSYRMVAAPRSLAP